MFRAPYGTGEEPMMIKNQGTISIIILSILIVLSIAPVTCGGAPAGASGSVSGQDLVGWQSQDIDGTSGYGPYFELAVDTNGKPHIATIQSRDEFASSLVYFTRELGVWKKEVVDDQSAVLNDPQITTDLFGQPHIVYGYLIDGFSANYALKYAYKDRFGWHIENLTDTLGQTYGSASIVVNSRGSPRIAYLGYPGAGLMYASRDGTGWHTEMIDPDPSNWPVLRLDRNGDPRVVYTYFPTYFTREKRYAFRDRGTWNIEFLDQNHSGQNYDMELDLLGAPHIAFQRYTPGGPGAEVVYMTRDRTGWHEDSVAQGNLDDYSDVVVTGTGVVGVSYAPQNSESEVTSIHYAVKTGTGWSPETAATTEDSSELRPGTGMASGSGGKVYLTASRAVFTGNAFEVTPFLATRELRVPGFG
jgi:hypothetical protein